MDNCTSGIGGFLKDRDQNILYIFSGHSDALSPLRAELEAIIHIIKVIFSSNKKHSSCRLFSDCETLVNALNKVKAGGVSDLFLDINQCREMVESLKISFVHIDRSLNVGADDLAKQGLSRSSLVGG